MLPSFTSHPFHKSLSIFWFTTESYTAPPLNCTVAVIDMFVPDQRRLTNIRTERTVRTWRSHPICLLGVLLYHDMVLLIMLSLQYGAETLTQISQCQCCISCCCLSVRLEPGYMLEMWRGGGSHRDWQCGGSWWLTATADTQTGDNVIIRPVHSPVSQHNYNHNHSIKLIINPCLAYFLSLSLSLSPSVWIMSIETIINW